MFSPGSSARTAPTLGPCFSENGTASLGDLLSSIGASSPDTYATIGSMFYAIVQSANNGVETPLRTNCRKMFVGNSYTNYQDNERFPGNPVDRSGTQGIADIQDQLSDNLPSCGGWLLDLVNAAKKKPVDDQNVTGYFASIKFECSKPIKIAKFINMIAPYLEDIIADRASRDLLSKTVWTEYRISRCSTGKILHENSAVLKVLGVISDIDDAAITAASNAPWDISLADAIPNRIKAYCAIYLDAAGRGIDKWHQGNKAMDALPAAKIRSSKKIFKKYLDTVNDIEDLEKAKTADEVVAAIPNGFFA